MSYRLEKSCDGSKNATSGLAVYDQLFQSGGLELKSLSGPHVGNQTGLRFHEPPSAKRQCNAERPRCCMGRSQIKLWEELDFKSPITGDVRGDAAAFALGGVAIWLRRAHPSRPF